MSGFDDGGLSSLVLKVIGQDGTYPKYKSNVDALFKKRDDALSDFNDLRDNLESQMAVLKSVYSDIVDEAKRVKKIFADDNFGLDKKDKDDLKKIKQCVGYSDRIIGEIEDSHLSAIKNVNGIFKDVVAMKKFKGPD